MTTNKQHLDEWRRLFESALHVKKMAPWEWMEETDIFGVKNPDSDEIVF